MLADSNAWIVCFGLASLFYQKADEVNYDLSKKQEANHLVIDPEHVGDVDADVNGVHLVGVGEVKLVVVLDRGF